MRKNPIDIRIIAGVIALVIVAFILVVWGSYNNLVKLSQGVDSSWANIETQYQRRMDLVPNLVNVVESYAAFERNTLTEITNIRSQWQTAQNPEQQVNLANQFESTLSKLLLITENYPDLKASSQFTQLSDNLAEPKKMVKGVTYERPRGGASSRNQCRLQ